MRTDAGDWESRLTETHAAFSTRKRAERARAERQRKAAHDARMAQRVVVQQRICEREALDVQKQIAAEKAERDTKRARAIVRRVQASKLSIAMAKRQLTVVNAKAPRALMVSAILAQVAHKNGVTVEEIRSASLARHITVARQHAMYELRNNTELSWKQIALAVGVTDHTTAIYGAKAHAKRVKA